MSDSSPLLEVRELVKEFPVRGGILNRIQSRVHAVNGVSFDVQKGETLGIVGESGCGKSTLGKCIVQLHRPTSGSIRFEGEELVGKSHHSLMPYRRKLQMVFQDPYSSLNPRLTVEKLLEEVIRFHRVIDKGTTSAYIDELIRTVGLTDDARSKFPHEFSGGQRQRIGIARALALKPEFLIADEPVSALDVSIQAQVLNLLMDLRDQFGLTVLFISHDLKVIEHFCDRVLVMYLGHIVEELSCDGLHENAKHPYTRALLGANPVNDPDDRRPLDVLEGDVPSPFDPPSGCPFTTRCERVEERCSEALPTLRPCGDDQRVACFVVEDELLAK